MEPEGPSPHLQVPATCPYPQPARSLGRTRVTIQVQGLLIDCFAT